MLTAEEQEEQFLVLDRDGDGEVSFEEFECWWKGLEAEQLMGDMDAAEVREALEEAGVVVEEGTSTGSMRAALKHQCR